MTPSSGMEIIIYTYCNTWIFLLCVKFVPIITRKTLPKGRNFTYLEDPYIYIYIEREREFFFQYRYISNHFPQNWMVSLWDHPSESHHRMVFLLGTWGRSLGQKSHWNDFYQKKHLKIWLDIWLAQNFLSGFLLSKRNSHKVKVLTRFFCSLSGGLFCWKDMSHGLTSAKFFPGSQRTAERMNWCWWMNWCCKKNTYF